MVVFHGVRFLVDERGAAGKDDSRLFFGVQTPQAYQTDGAAIEEAGDLNHCHANQSSELGPLCARLSSGGNQNHSLRYATHQLMQKIGMVAPSAHQIGNAKSAISPRTMKVIQKIFRCIGLV